MMNTYYKILIIIFCVFSNNTITFAEPINTHAIGIWAANGASCDNAKMYLLITDAKIVAIAKGKIVAKIANLEDIKQNGKNVEIVTNENEIWHMKFESRDEGKIIKREVNGHRKPITDKQKKLLNLKRCKKI